MKMPFPGGFAVTSPFGWRTDPITGEDAWHGGIDLVGDTEDVTSVGGGVVLRSRIVTDPADRTWEWGNYVSVQADDGTVVYYCHLAARRVASGDRVEPGTPIGIEGETGRVTGRHLHFEVRRNGVQIDAAAYLGIPNRAGVRVGAETLPKDGDGAHPWGRDAVAWAVKRGILRGDGAGHLRLGDACTREEVTAMLYRALGGNQDEE